MRPALDITQNDFAFLNDPYNSNKPELKVNVILVSILCLDPSVCLLNRRGLLQDWLHAVSRLAGMVPTVGKITITLIGMPKENIYSTALIVLWNSQFTVQYLLSGNSLMQIHWASLINCIAQSGNLFRQNMRGWPLKLKEEPPAPQH